MGRSNRQKPARLAGKLHAIRKQLALSQWQLIERLDCPEQKLHAASISQYEWGKREPPLLVLLQYARVAGVPMELLVDDERELPDPLPSMMGSELVMELKKRGRASERR
jgi:transcriptional regulator with XRE-family HTH domain